MYKVPKISEFDSSLTVQSDKSISHRSVIFASLAKGKSRIRNILRAEDVMNTVRIFRQLGVEIKDEKGILTVHGKGLHGLQEPQQVLNTGNSGTGIRLLSGLLAGQNFTSFITGDDSIVQRPMARVITPLTLMGADITGKQENTKAPLCIRPSKKMKGIRYEMPVASAQVKSALLLAGLYAKGRTIVQEKTPTRDHTERMMKAFGINLKTEKESIILDQGGKDFSCHDLTVPADISSANFFIVLTLLKKGSKLRLKDVGLNPTRTGILKVLEDCQARFTVSGKNMKDGEERGDILCEYTPDLKPIRISPELSANVIDEIPILSILASQIEGTSEFRHLEELRFKESDRIKSIVTNLRAMGASVKEFNDGFSVTGGTPLHAADIRSYNDHRIVMSFCVAAQFAKGSTRIDDTSSVGTSFPQFFNLLESLNG